MGKKSKADGNAGWGCLAAFAVPFIAIGFGLLGWLGLSFFRWAEAQSWVETPATLQHAELKRHSGDKGQTFEAKARYSYVFEGVEHESDRVSLQSGGDNIGSYQEDLAKELKQLKAAGAPTVCFVDPDQPEQSVLRRDLRPGRLFLEGMMGILFASMGVGLLGGAWYVRRKDQQEQVAKAAAPKQPWLWREDWAAGVVKPSSGKSLVGFAVFTVVWNFVSWPIAVIFFVVGGKDDQPWAPLFVSFFPAIGCAFLGATLWQWARYRRWRGSTFELATLPGVVGGTLAGVVHAPGGMAPREGFQLTLTCIERVMRSTSKGEKRQDKPIWQDDRVVTRELLENDPSATAIPVQFYIPFEAKPTGSPSDVRWELSVHADVPGIDYREVFEVPVFKTAESSKSPPEDVDALSEYQRKPSLEAAVRECGGVVLWQTAETMKLAFPPARNKGAALGLTVFTVVWAAICAGLFWSDFPIFLPIVFSCFGLVLLYTTLNTWLDARVFEVTSEGVTASGGWLGWGRERSFPRDVISDIVIDHGMQTGNKLYHRITLWMPGDKSQMLCRGIARRSTAQLIRDEIVRILRLDPADS